MRAASCSDCCMSLLSGIKRISPLILLGCYSIFGGWMFSQLEGSAKNNNKDVSENYTETVPVQQFETNWSKVYIEVSNNLSNFYGSYKLTHHYENILRLNLTHHLWYLDRQYYGQVPDNDIRRAWDEYDTLRFRPEKFMEFFLHHQNDTINKYTVAIEQENETNPWDDLWTSTLYAATLYTTIGYGNIAPATTEGRVATMVYALFGIPMVLAILNECGQIMFNVLKKLNMYYKKCMRRRRKWALVAAGTADPQEVTDLPVTAAIGILVFWLCMCAGVFLIWEDWDYFTSFYFFFITLTTIGLGDVVPENAGYTLMAFLLVLFGLSVVSMSINIIQSNIENAFNAMIRNIDYEYLQKQINPEASTMSDANYSGGLGVLSLWKNKPLKERILMNLMGEQRKQMLEQHWEEKARNRNVACQTENKQYANSNLQVDLDGERTSSFSSNKARKYIYNLAD